MKKFILLLLLSSFCFGQDRESLYDEFEKLNALQNHTFVIDDKIVNKEYLKNLHADEIESVSILRCEKENIASHLCYGSKRTIIITTKNSISDYNLIVTELGFDSFLAQQKSEGFYSLEFLKSQNRLYVNRWNQKVLTDNPDIFDIRIDYDSKIDYGLEIEYKLYQFFKFIEHKHNIKLI